MARLRVIAVGWVLCGLMFADAAAAQKSDAPQDLFDLGVQHMDAGRYEIGCLLIEQSYAKDPRPGTLFTLADCETERGYVASAVARYEEYLAMYADLPPEKKAQQGTRPMEARSKIAALAPKVPMLTLVMPPYAPEGTVVKRDGRVVPAPKLGVELPTNPGDHLITTQAPGGPVTEARVTLGVGEKKRLVLDVVQAATRGPDKSDPEPSAGPGGRRIAVYVSGGVGAAGILASVITGIIALDWKSTADAYCSGMVCEPRGIKATDAMKVNAWASTATLGVGLAGVGVAAALFFTEPSKPSGSAGGARWVSAGVMPAGPGGAMLGLQGAW